jgi:4-amino-4-deoxy-L-arabinose transferase-like glycosyltransferase
MLAEFTPRGMSRMSASAWIVVLSLCLFCLLLSLLALASCSLRRRARWTGLASALGVLLSFVSFGGTKDGVGLEHTWLLILVLCLIALPISLLTLISRPPPRLAKRVALASAIGIVVSFVSFGLTHDANTARTTTGQGPVQAVTPIVEGRSEGLAEEIRRSIEEKRVIVGMTPQEARWAGGASFYKVQADPQRWSPGSDPFVVMARQARDPDDSKITLTFRNTTQFRSPAPVTFRVEIRRGRVTEIAAVDGN